MHLSPAAIHGDLKFLIGELNRSTDKYKRHAAVYHASHDLVVNLP